MFDSHFDNNFGFVILSAEDSIFLRQTSGVEVQVKEDLSSKRSQEFYLGRVAASRALSLLGVNLTSPVIRGQRGEPIWPPGAIGSISHSGGFAACVVCPRGRVVSIGLDLECLNRKLAHDISRRICTTDETIWIKEGKFEENRRLITLFSIKESAYKATYQLLHIGFRFLDVSIIYSELEQTYAIRFSKDLFQTMAPFQFSLKVSIQNNFILSSAIITQRQ